MSCQSAHLIAFQVTQSEEALHHQSIGKVQCSVVTYNKVPNDERGLTAPPDKNARERSRLYLCVVESPQVQTTPAPRANGTFETEAMST